MLRPRASERKKKRAGTKTVAEKSRLAGPSAFGRGLSASSAQQRAWRGGPAGLVGLSGLQLAFMPHSTGLQWLQCPGRPRHSVPRSLAQACPRACPRACPPAGARAASLSRLVVYGRPPRCSATQQREPPSRQKYVVARGKVCHVKRAAAPARDSPDDRLDDGLQGARRPQPGEAVPPPPLLHYCLTRFVFPS